MRKSCEQCGNDGTLAVCWLLSTVGKSPRVQKCSRGTILCTACLRQLIGPNQSKVPPLLGKRLSEAFTAVRGRSSGLSAPTPLPRPVPVPDRAEVSK